MPTPRARRDPSVPPVIDIYARISKETAVDLRRRTVSSTTDQVTMLTAELARRGAVLGEVFEDTSLSGWQKKVVRPSFNKLMARLESGACDGVIVKDLTRFSRKVSEGEALLEVAQEGRLVWDLHGAYDLSTADGILRFRNAVATAAHESNKISERTKDGKMFKAERGRSNATWRPFGLPGNLPRPDGWEVGDAMRPAPDELVAAEADGIRQVADMLLAGANLAECARYLTSLGLLTPMGYEWSADSLGQTLKRPSLHGAAVYKGVTVGQLPGEPVLDPELHARLISTMAARRPGRQPSTKYLLTGVLYCGRCDKQLCGRPQSARTPYGPGEPARAYWCQKRPGGNQDGNRGGCGRLTVDLRLAEEVVTEAALARLGDPRHQEALRRSADRAQAERAKLKAEEATLVADGLSLAGMMAKRGAAWVDTAMAPIDARLAEIEAHLAALDTAGYVPDRAASVAEVLADWKAGSVDDKRAMIKRAFPHGIAVLPSSSRGLGARNDRKRFRWTRQPETVLA